MAMGMASSGSGSLLPVVPLLTSDPTGCLDFISPGVSGGPDLQTPGDAAGSSASLGGRAGVSHYSRLPVVADGDRGVCDRRELIVEQK